MGMMVDYHIVKEKVEVRTSLNNPLNGGFNPYNVIKIGELNIFATKEQLKEIADSINETLENETLEKEEITA